MEFTKKFLKEKLFTGPWFNSKKLELKDISIDELLDIQDNQVSARVEGWTSEGSTNTASSYHFRNCFL